MIWVPLLAAAIGCGVPIAALLRVGGWSRARANAGAPFLMAIARCMGHFHFEMIPKSGLTKPITQ